MPGAADSARPNTRPAPGGAHARLDSLLDEINDACQSLEEAVGETPEAATRDSGPQPSDAGAPDVRPTELLDEINEELTTEPSANETTDDDNDAIDELEGTFADPDESGAERRDPAASDAPVAAVSEDAQASSGAEADDESADPSSDDDGTFEGMFEDPDTGDSTPADVTFAESDAPPANATADEDEPAGDTTSSGEDRDEVQSPSTDVATDQPVPSASDPQHGADDREPLAGETEPVVQPKPDLRHHSLRPHAGRRPTLADRARPALLPALRVVGKPLANQPRVVRDSVGWIGAMTVFYGLCLWLYVLVFHDSGPTPAETTPTSAVVAPVPPLPEEPAIGDGD